MAAKDKIHWAGRPFFRVLDDLERADVLLHLAMQGIATLTTLPRLVEALAPFEGIRDLNVESDHPKLTVEGAKATAEFAEREVDSGFSLLHAQAAIALWVSLEDVVRTFLATWLHNEPGAKQVDAVQKLKISVMDYEAMDEEERCLYIVELLEREAAARHGIERFECLLRPFGLSGAFQEEPRRDLYELYHVRNLLVHRAGRVDRRFAKACPWLGLTPGEIYVVDHTSYGRYHAATVQYITEIVYRVREHFGWGRNEVPDHRRHSQSEA
jgi:hypothetical protein